MDQKHEILIGRIVRVITNSNLGFNWEADASIIGASNIAQKYNLHINSVYDQYYQINLTHFFSELEPSVLISFLQIMLNDSKHLREKFLEYDEELYKYLINPEGNIDLLRPILLPSSEKYLAFDDYPTIFFKKLEEELNIAYDIKLFCTVRILSRKLIENLIIEILRKKFGMQNINLFFNPHEYRFLAFRKLMENLEDKKGDFLPYSQSFNNQSLYQTIEKFIDVGNGAAHSIDEQITKVMVDDLRQDLTYLVQLFSSTFNKI